MEETLWGGACEPYSVYFYVDDKTNPHDQETLNKISSQIKMALTKANNWPIIKIKTIHFMSK